jgi:aspartyl-tRNA(Asn)/glutamyl-tRNA(Gln) amidotransferase subunit A
MLRMGETSPSELVALHLDQIRATEERIRAYVTINQNAMRQARRMDKKVKTGRNGILFGIPISFKDNFETRGIRTTCSSEILREYVPTTDATVVKKLKSAGIIVLGKLNMHEFAQGGLTPPTRNPWNTECIAGGSSGGSGAAVAAGSALAATGSDTGGSIRGPSSFCGVVGLKPTYGRVSRHGIFPASWSLDHAGPIVRRVEDAAVMLTIMAGSDASDPTTSDLPVTDYVRAIGGQFKGLKLGVPTNHFFEGCDSRVSKVVRRAIHTLETLGCKTIDFEFPHVEEIMAARQSIEMCEATAYHLRWLTTYANRYKPDVRSNLEQGLFVPAVYYIQALRFRAKVFPEIVKLFKKFDVMITPTIPVVATKTSVELKDETGMHCTGAFNLLGLPALSMPCGFVDGLPVGMQIVGNAFDEATVLKTGLAYERVSKFYQYEPPLALESFPTRGQGSRRFKSEDA